MAFDSYAEGMLILSVEDECSPTNRPVDAKEAGVILKRWMTLVSKMNARQKLRLCLSGRNFTQEGATQLATFFGGLKIVSNGVRVIEMSGLTMYRFSETVVNTLPFVKRTACRGGVTNTKGLLYDNCSGPEGLQELFSGMMAERCERAKYLENNLFHILQQEEYDFEGRQIAPCRLFTAEGAEPQKAHVDYLGLNGFCDYEKKRLPLTCLFPVTEQGAYIQVWPTGQGEGKIIRLELGEVMFFSPFLIHGGGLGDGCLRVQAYIYYNESWQSLGRRGSSTQHYQQQTVYETETEQRIAYSMFCESCVERTST